MEKPEETKICLFCKEQFTRTTELDWTWGIKQFCSATCRGNYNSAKSCARARRARELLQMEEWKETNEKPQEDQ